MTSVQNGKNRMEKERQKLWGIKNVDNVDNSVYNCFLGQPQGLDMWMKFGRSGV